MRRFAPLFVLLAVLYMVFLMTGRAAAARIPLPSVSVILPGELASQPGAIDFVYHRLVNAFTERYPECTHLRSQRRWTPLRSTMLITLRCLKMGRSVAEVPALDPFAPRPLTGVTASRAEPSSASFLNSILKFHA